MVRLKHKFVTLRHLLSEPWRQEKSNKTEMPKLQTGQRLTVSMLTIAGTRLGSIADVHVCECVCAWCMCMLACVHVRDTHESPLKLDM